MVFNELDIDDDGHLDREEFSIFLKNLSNGDYDLEGLP